MRGGEARMERDTGTVFDFYTYCEERRSAQRKEEPGVWRGKATRRQQVAGGRQVARPEESKVPCLGMVQNRSGISSRSECPIQLASLSTSSGLAAFRSVSIH